MGANFPQDQLNMEVGIWNTDAMDESTVVLTGDTSIKFDGVATRTSLLSDFIDIEGGRSYSGSGIVQADDIAAGNPFRIQIEFYDIDQVIIGGAADLFDSELLTVDAWQRAGNVFGSPDTGRYIKLRFEKNTTNLTTFYLDSVHLRKLPMGGGLFRDTSAQTINSGAWTTVELNQTIWGLGNMVQDTTNFLVQAESGLAAHITAKVTLDTVAAGTVAQLRLNINSGTRFVYGPIIDAPNSEDLPVILTEDLFLSPHDTVELELQHDDAPSADANTGDDVTYMKITEWTM